MNLNKKATASIQLLILLLGFFSFVFIISETPLISAAGVCNKDNDVAWKGKVCLQNDECGPGGACVPEGTKDSDGNTINPITAIQAAQAASNLKDKVTNLDATDEDKTPKEKQKTTKTQTPTNAQVDELLEKDPAKLADLQLAKEIRDQAYTDLTDANKKLLDAKRTLANAEGEEAIKEAKAKVTEAQTEVNTKKGALTDANKEYSELNNEINPKAGSSYLSSFLGASGGGLADALLSGLQWGVIAYGAGYLLGSLFGFSDNNVQALSTALAAGAFTYKFLATKSGLFASGSAAPALIGIGVGAIVFIAMYKNVETELVRFSCLPWQPPTGGNNCDLCNDGDLPCSEYRCRSLGQSCELVNAGTEQEQCVNVNRNDVNPPIIKPLQEELTSGHTYADIKLSPPGPGFTIRRTDANDGCLKAFTPLQFGVETDEPSQCRIDYKSTDNYDEMIAYMGGSNLYKKNHTEVFALPGAKAYENSSFALENGKDLTFYLRCQDKNGNVNPAEYAIKFCMDPTPDTTAPIIKATSIENGGCVAENTDTANVEFYTDEPADCRWSHTDQNYDNMANDMACSMNLYQLNAQQLFTCSAELSGIARDGTDFYIRCKDQPGMAEADRNKNTESYQFHLKGSTALKLKQIMPNNTILGGVSPAPVELYAETLFGCEAGRSTCFYSTTGLQNDYIAFYDTDNTDGISTQRQDLPAGQHTYFVKCVDSGGNVAEDVVDFTVDIDTNPPVIARIYEEEQMLKIITVRESECSYTYDNCDFTFNEGTAMPYANSTIHVAEWNDDNTYYIKCRDEFLNEEAGCSAIVKPSQLDF